MDEYEYKPLEKSEVSKILKDPDKALAEANKGTEGIKFSDNPETAIIEKAMLYHKIRGDAKLRRGDTGPDSINKLKKMAGDITGGKDPVTEFIKSRGNTAERLDLIVEMTRLDRNKAWFEQAIELSEQKKAEAEALLKKNRPQEPVNEPQKSEKKPDNQDGKPDNQEKKPVEKQPEPEVKPEEPSKPEKAPEKKPEEPKQEQQEEYQEADELEGSADKSEKQPDSEWLKKELMKDFEDEPEEVPKENQDEYLDRELENLEREIEEEKEKEQEKEQEEQETDELEDSGGKPEEKKVEPEPVKESEEKKPEEKKPEEKKPEPEPEKKPSEPESKPEEAPKKPGEKPEEKVNGVPGKGLDEMRAEAALLQSRLLRNMAENRECTPKEFLGQPENLEAIKKVMAIENHISQVEMHTKELEEALKYEDPVDRKIALRNRPPFACEKAAAGDYEGYLKSLGNSTEVTAALQKMAEAEDLQELSKNVAWIPKTHPSRDHENLGLMENRMVPGAIKEFLEGPDGPEKDSKLAKKLNELSCMNEDNKLEGPVSSEECDKRIKEYKDILDRLEKDKKLETEGGKALSETLKGQIERLEDVSLAPEREKVKIKYRTDVDIKYFDPENPDRPMDAVEAREKLIRGVELEKRTFKNGDSVGKSEKITYDKDSGKMKISKEKVISRIVDLSKKDSLHPEQQLDDLKRIMEALKKSDVFYSRNPESYNKTMESLKKVIKTHENLGPDANIRQVAQLKSLYGELDDNIGEYLSEHGDKLKEGGRKANIRDGALRSLRSITNKDHVQKMSKKLFEEEHKLQQQQKMARPFLKVFDKWQKAGPPKDQTSRDEFMKDFNNVASHMEKMAGNLKDPRYARLAMNANGKLDDFIQKAEELSKEKGSALDKGKLDKMKDFSGKSKEDLKDYYGMNPDAKPAKKEKEKTKDGPEMEKPAKINNGPAK